MAGETLQGMKVAILVTDGFEQIVPEYVAKLING